MAEAAPPGPKKDRRPLTAGAITEAAMGLADSEGLEAVTIRRVAAELDARPMSLYGYFASKSELLAAMTNEGVGEMLVSRPLSEDWREAITVTARKMYATFAAHPWLLSVFATGTSPAPNAVRLAKQMARAVAGLPLEQADIWQVHGIVNDYVTGYSFRLAATPTPQDMEAAISPSDVVEFPELAALPANLRLRSSVERFELGLQTVLDGIERRFLERG